MSSSTQRPRRDTLARNVPSSAKPKLLHRRTERSLINWSLSIKATDQLQVIVSLSNHPYSAGYVLNSAPDRLEDGAWLEIFNSDAAQYGGANSGNFGAAIPAQNGRFEAVLPANGVLIFGKSAPTASDPVLR